MIAVIDYGVGNLFSLSSSLSFLGLENRITRSWDEVRAASHIILPGVGAFGDAMEKLAATGLVPVLREEAKKGKPLLGICLGMQLLGRRSEEGKEEGLGLIPFDNVRFQLGSSYKIPHMGWNYIEIVNERAPIVKDLDRRQRYYFVHSYHAKCDDDGNVLMTCDYGYPFAAAVVKEQIYGVQFHPEKSHQFGMRLLKNFVEECAQ